MNRTDVSTTVYKILEKHLLCGPGENFGRTLREDLTRLAEEYGESKYDEGFDEGRNLGYAEGCSDSAL